METFKDPSSVVSNKRINKNKIMIGDLSLVFV